MRYRMLIVFPLLALLAAVGIYAGYAVFSRYQQTSIDIPEICSDLVNFSGIDAVLTGSVLRTDWKMIPLFMPEKGDVVKIGAYYDVSENGFTRFHNNLLYFEYTGHTVDIRLIDRDIMLCTLDGEEHSAVIGNEKQLDYCLKNHPMLKSLTINFHLYYKQASLLCGFSQLKYLYILDISPAEDISPPSHPGNLPVPIDFEFLARVDSGEIEASRGEYRLSSNYRFLPKSTLLVDCEGFTPLDPFALSSLEYYISEVPTHPLISHFRIKSDGSIFPQIANKTPGRSEIIRCEVSRKSIEKLLYVCRDHCREVKDLKVVFTGGNNYQQAIDELLKFSYRSLTISIGALRKRDAPNIAIELDGDVKTKYFSIMKFRGVSAISVSLTIPSNSVCKGICLSDVHLKSMECKKILDTFELEHVRVDDNLTIFSEIHARKIMLERASCGTPFPFFSKLCLKSTRYLFSNIPIDEDLLPDLGYLEWLDLSYRIDYELICDFLQACPSLRCFSFSGDEYEFLNNYHPSLLSHQNLSIYKRYYDYGRGENYYLEDEKFKLSVLNHGVICIREPDWPPARYCFRVPIDISFPIELE